MVAFAMDLFRSGATEVTIRPDGEHFKRHDLLTTLSSYGFIKKTSTGTTKYGGRYEANGKSLVVHPCSGLGDVTATIDDTLVFAECKGGVINSTHSGITSRLRKGLAEAVGQLMSRELGTERHIAVVPDCPESRALAAKMKERAGSAGIEIALVSTDGIVHLV